MAKIHICFNGKDYFIDEKALANAIAALKAALVKLQTSGTLAAGLYDANDNLIASWDELTNTYGMDVTKSYINPPSNRDPQSPYTIFNNYPVLQNGKKLVLGDVTSIGYEAFAWCTNLTEIVIPDSVTSIGERAFWACDGLTSINIPNSVTSIGNSAFAYCRGLTSVIIPNSVITLGEQAFFNCTNLTSIAIGHGLTSIEYGTFQGCVNLTHAIIPDSVTSIGESAFDNCNSLTEIVIPDSVISIDYEAFLCCYAVTSIVIGSGLTNIGPYAFYCTDVESISVSDDNTTYKSVGNCLIETASKTIIVGCSNSVMPTDGSVTSIGESSFSERMGLTDVVIPDSITHIGPCAFYYCENLSTVVLNHGLQSIETAAFGDCPTLNTIKYTGTMSQWDAVQKASDWNYGTPATYVECSDGNVLLSQDDK